MNIIELVKLTASEEYTNTNTLLKQVEDLQDEGYDVAGLLGAAVGMAGETGEFSELVKKSLFQRKPLDKTHAMKELGDVYWYFALACMALDTTPEQVEQVVSDKLLKRFKNGFTVEENLNRKEGDI